MTKPPRARIETARSAIQDVEEHLARAIRSEGSGARAEKREVSPEVRAALVRLRAAKAKLAHLERALAEADLDTARDALTRAESDLESMIERMSPAPRSSKTWVSPAIEDALERVAIARDTLRDLRESLEP